MIQSRVAEEAGGALGATIPLTEMVYPGVRFDENHLLDAERFGPRAFGADPLNACGLGAVFRECVDAGRSRVLPIGGARRGSL